MKSILLLPYELLLWALAPIFSSVPVYYSALEPSSVPLLTISQQDVKTWLLRLCLKSLLLLLLQSIATAHTITVLHQYNSCTLIFLFLLVRTSCALSATRQCNSRALHVLAKRKIIQSLMI